MAGSIDTITGFSVADDMFWLSRVMGTAAFGAFTALPAGALAAGAFWIGTGAHDADDRIIYNSATGALLYDADGTGIAAGLVQVATLVGVVGVMTAADFVVV